VRAGSRVHVEASVTHAIFAGYTGAIFHQPIHSEETWRKTWFAPTFYHLYRWWLLQCCTYYIRDNNGILVWLLAESHCTSKIMCGTFWSLLVHCSSSASSINICVKWSVELVARPGRCTCTMTTIYQVIHGDIYRSVLTKKWRLLDDNLGISNTQIPFNAWHVVGPESCPLKCWHMLSVVVERHGSFVFSKICVTKCCVGTETDLNFNYGSETRISGPAPVQASLISHLKKLLTT